MKSFRLFIVVALFSLSIGTTSVLSAATEIYGTMMVSKGDIKVVSVKTGKTESGKVGFKVYAGDSIVSGADSRAKIIMSDKNVLNISPDSKITIEKYENNAAKDTRNVELKVDYGKVRASVNESYDGEKNKFNVRTPTAVAGVRGTDFIAGFDQSTRVSSVVTFSGVVAVGQPGPAGTIVNPVFVQPGQQTSVSDGGKAAPPAAVPKEQMKSMDKESSADKSTGANATSTDSTSATADAKKDGKDGTDKKDVYEKKDGPDKKDASEKKDSSSDRKPASAGSNTGTSMIDAKDMDTSISKDIKFLDTPKVPVMVTPTISLPTVPVQNPFIDNAVKNQKSRVKVEICLPGKC